MKYLIVFFISIVFLVGCNETRAEGRRLRLDTFRQSLPQEILVEFDSIESIIDCRQVGLLITEARLINAEMGETLDSIKHAELIDLFTDVELVEFFWVYFAKAIETGSVPEIY